MKLRRKIYNVATAFMGMLAGVMLMWLMIWHVYEANDLTGALIMGGILMAMVCRETYHQWREEQRAKRRYSRR